MTYQENFRAYLIELALEDDELVSRAQARMLDDIRQDSGHNFNNAEFDVMSDATDDFTYLPKEDTIALVKDFFK